MEERFGFYLAIWAVLSFRKASKMLFWGPFVVHCKMGD